MNFGAKTTDSQIFILSASSHERQPINPMRDPNETTMSRIDKMLPPNKPGALENADERAQRECETINIS
jgi:hypothetical protein